MMTEQFVAPDAKGDFHGDWVWRPKAISPNAEYLAYVDLQGPHVLRPDGTVLYEFEGRDNLYYGNGIDIADNRIYYRRLE